MKVGNYQLTKTIGEGTFGRVKLGVDCTTGKEYAVKIMNKNDIAERELTVNVRREIGIMKQLNHRNIVGLHEVLSSTRKIYMVMDLVRGGELFRHMERHNEHGDVAVRKYFQQMVDGLDYCHRRGVCHRDLKPENLLVDENGILKVTDFGVSAVIKTTAEGDSHLLHTACGTPYYCAPEILTSHGEGYDGIKIDSWSAGVILYRMLVGELPFQGSNMPQLVIALERGNVKYPASLGPEATDLLKKLLEKSPARRITFAEVKRHPWFTKDYEQNRQRLGRAFRSSELSNYGRSLSREESRRSDLAEEPKENGLSRRPNSGRMSSLTPPDVAVRGGNEHAVENHSSGDELRRHESPSHQVVAAPPPALPQENGKARKADKVLSDAIEESNGDLVDFVYRILPTKADRVPEVVQKLQEVGCEDVDDFMVVMEQYKTHSEFVGWLEQKANIQPVLALRLARVLNIT
mmetsp:Transcript_9423/g.28450  ORF Transcript_9423/g.28450 Transcript_9423/m.28450 type:complete len:462 (-) Transcript_9423:182-1567(-)